MAERIDLLIIDPQVSFCDPDKGELYVPDAEKDMERVGNLIENLGKKISKVHVTLDCHYKIDIAHPKFWRNSEGENPKPFTIITSKNIKEGTWFPVFPNLRQRSIDYCEQLEVKGKYDLCVWPEHCLISSNGNRVYPYLYEKLDQWQNLKVNNVDYVSKGSNICTEHYSAICSEIPDPQDPSTQLNTRLINTLMEADKVLICGEASSHCLRFTVEDIANNFNDDTVVKKLCLLEDGTSPVISPFVDFPAITQQFIVAMKARGMQVAKTTDF